MDVQGTGPPHWQVCVLSSMVSRDCQNSLSGHTCGSSLRVKHTPQAATQCAGASVCPSVCLLSVSLCISLCPSDPEICVSVLFFVSVSLYFFIYVPVSISINIYMYVPICLLSVFMFVYLCVYLLSHSSKCMIIYSKLPRYKPLVGKPHGCLGENRSGLR